MRNEGPTIDEIRLIEEEYKSKPCENPVVGAIGLTVTAVSLLFFPVGFLVANIIDNIRDK